MQSRLCGAKTRAEPPCRSRPVPDRTRCRMHGGAPGSGSQIGNKNALKHINAGRPATADCGAFAATYTGASRSYRERRL